MRLPVCLRSLSCPDVNIVIDWWSTVISELAIHVQMAVVAIFAISFLDIQHPYILYLPLLDTFPYLVTCLVTLIFGLGYFVAGQKYASREFGLVSIVILS
jgi:hypothetical protein